MLNYFPVTHSILSAEALTTDVLLNYGLDSITSLKFLNYGLNDTYAITTASADKYVFRVYRAGWRSLSDISFEIDVLNHLARRNASVSTPVQNKEGNFIQTFLAPEGLRHAVLFTHAAGSPPQYKEQAGATAFTYGKLVGIIHAATQDFTSQHTRFPLDLPHLLDTPLKSIGPLLSHRADDWAYLQKLADKIRRCFAEFPSTALEQGFCHGDFHGGNAHMTTDGVLTFFDFDCCGWGWRAYDLAIFQWGAKRASQVQERWEPFLRGYTESRKLNDLDLQAVPLFVMMRQFWLLGLHTANGHDWGFGWLNDRYFDTEIKFLRDWEAERFADEV